MKSFVIYATAYAAVVAAIPLFATTGDLGIGWQTVIQALIAGVVAIALGWLQHRTKKAVEEVAAEAAKKVDVVKTTLVNSTVETGGKLDSIAEVGMLTHDLVNSASLVQMKLYAAAQKRIAELTKDKVDLDAAQLALTMVADHERKQDEAIAKTEGTKK